MKTLRRGLLGVLACLLAAALGYVGYAMAAYYRLEDSLPLEAAGGQEAPAERGVPYTLVSYNLGFGAYSPDYSFFMDGGRESRAFSKEAVLKNVGGALEAVRVLGPDFALLQEADVDADRSYHVNQAALASEALEGFGSVFAQNYDSPYLLWPLTKPHGASRSGLVTLSRYRVESAVRRRLPVETGLSKFLDLDRCYSVVRVPVAGGGTLCLYHVHLSAYTSDGAVATEQLRLLLADMAAEYQAGNYAVCGGDFNKDLLGDSAGVFGVLGHQQTWAQPFPAELLPEGIALHAPKGAAGPVPSCRNADGPYTPGETFVLTVDGFLASDNVEVLAAEAVDTGFAWSDHNPVLLRFSLE